VVPRESVGKLADLEILHELEPHPRVQSPGREALRHDPIDAEAIFAAEPSLALEKLDADARGKALQLNLQARALEQGVERSPIGSRLPVVAGRAARTGTARAGGGRPRRRCGQRCAEECEDHELPDHRPRTPCRAPCATVRGRCISSAPEETKGFTGFREWSRRSNR